MTAQMETASAVQTEAKPAEAKPEAKAEQTPAATASQPTAARKPAAAPVAKAKSKPKTKSAAKSAAKSATKRKVAATRKTKTTRAAKSAARKAARPAAAKPAAPRTKEPTKDVEAMFENSLKQMQDVLTEFGGGMADLPIASEEFNQAMEATRDATVTGMTELNKELSEFTQNRMTECWEITRGMMSAKSLPEALEVQSRYLQDAYKAYADEAQKLNTITTDVTQKAFAPVANGFADAVTKMFSGRSA